MKQIVSWAALIAVPLVLLTGCPGGTSAVKEEAAAPKTAPVAAAQVVQEAAPVVTPSQAMPEAVAKAHPLDDPNSLLSKRKVYFDFDKDSIKAEFKDIVAAHAQYLMSNPSATIVLEGNCDERGTREYNMALGERRARAVMQALTLQGVSAKQITMVSYGEERPEDPGHSEDAWSKNRRVFINYTSR